MKAMQPRVRISAAAVCLLLVPTVLVLRAAANQAQQEANQVAVFTNKGAKYVGQFADISAPRSVLQFKGGRQIRLKAIWLINFLDRKWFFPEELEKMEKDENTLFLKDGSIITGRIIDYNERLRAFELDEGRTVVLDKVKRIYFSKTMPPRLSSKLKKQLKK